MDQHFVVLGWYLFFDLYGFITWKSKPAEKKQSAAESITTRKQIIFALTVSLLNPHAVLDTVGVIGTSSIKYIGADKIAFAASCIIVSWLWFAGLGIAGRAAGRRDQSGRLLAVVNTISALIMWGTALFLGYSLFQLLI